MADPSSNLRFAPLDDDFELVGEEQPSAQTLFRVAREKASGRKVGIQRLRPDISGDEVEVKRFAASAALSKNLYHPNILRVFSVARDSASPYCILEWPENGTLAHRLERGPLTPRDAYEVALAVAEALRYAHSRGVLHDDVRPANVVIMADGSVRLAGFGQGGIGSLPHAELQPDPYRLTDELRSDGAFDASSDIFGFGGMLYHMLTGEPPYSVALGLVPQAFRDTIRGCVALKRKERFTDFDQVIESLRANELEPGEQTMAPSVLAEDSRRDEGTLSGLSLSGGHGDVLPESSRSQRFSLSSPSLSQAPSESFPFAEASAAGSGGAEVSGASRSFEASDGPPSGHESGSGTDETRSNFPYRPADELYELGKDSLDGGMGAVVKSVERATGRFVAIKRIHKHVAMDEVMVQRFHREALSIAKLSHPHILQLLQPARDEHGDYLVLEWAGGGSLNDRIKKEGRLSFVETIGVARKIGAALAYAHGKGVIHRDIKPHNILLTESREPKLADFGLVRSIGEQTISSSKAGAGTPLYMAPEQWSDSHRADARSDIYSFGKTLYHLITGEKPATIDLSAVPFELRAVIAKCLEEEPHRRFASIDQMLAALDRALAPGRSKAPKVIAVMLFLIIVAGGGATWFFRERLFPAPAPASAGGGRQSDGREMVQRFAEAQQRRRDEAVALRKRVDALASDRSALAPEDAATSRALVDAFDGALRAATASVDQIERNLRGTGSESDVDAVAAAMEPVQKTIGALEGELRSVAALLPAARDAESRLKQLDGFRAAARPLLPADRIAEIDAAADSLARELEQAVSGATLAGAAAQGEAIERVRASAKEQERALLAALIESAKAEAGEDEKRLADRIALARRIDASDSDAAVLDQARTERIAAVAARREALARSLDDAALRRQSVGAPKGSFEGFAADVEAARAALVAADGEIAAGHSNAASRALASGRDALESAGRRFGDELAGAIESFVAAADATGARRGIELLRSAAPDHPHLRALERMAGTTPRLASGFDAVVARRAGEPWARIVKHRKSGIELALVDAGTLASGLKLAAPLYVGRFEVTCGQWKRFLADKANAFAKRGDEFPSDNTPSESDDAQFGDELPVVYVTYEQAERFCKWAGDGIRLPTADEWEYACRGAVSGTYWWGDSLEDGAGRLNLFGTSTQQRRSSLAGQYEKNVAFDDGYVRLAPVGAFREFGYNSNLLYDVLGNVAEWCADGEAGGTHCARGGSWKSSPERLRCADRTERSGYDDDLGFRVVCPVSSALR